MIFLYLLNSYTLVKSILIYLTTFLERKEVNLYPYLIPKLNSLVYLTNYSFNLIIFSRPLNFINLLLFYY